MKSVGEWYITAEVRRKRQLGGNNMPCDKGITDRHCPVILCKDCKHYTKPGSKTKTEADKGHAALSNSTDWLSDNKVLRELLWLYHGCSQGGLYGDDGERQCNSLHCMIDFKRDSVEEIRTKLGGR